MWKACSNVRWKARRLRVVFMVVVQYILMQNKMLRQPRVQDECRSALVSESGKHAFIGLNVPRHSIFERNKGGS